MDSAAGEKIPDGEELYQIAAASHSILVSDIIEVREFGLTCRQMQRIISAEQHKLTIGIILVRPMNHKGLFPAAEPVCLRECKRQLLQQSIVAIELDRVIFLKNNFCRISREFRRVNRSGPCTLRLNPSPGAIDRIILPPFERSKPAARQQDRRGEHETQAGCR